MAYIYNADGNRVAKGTISTMSCDPSTNGFQTTADYVRDPSGNQLTELDTDSNGNITGQHTNVYANGQLIGTYDRNGLHFYLNDWLGTRRVQTNYAGVIEQTCTSQPFGDQLACTESLQSPTENHFTGKERDIESGLDSFGARYYASTMGRWMSPDESLDGAIMELPQTWNKYSYEYNRPLYGTDPDGRCPPCIGAVIGGVVEGGWNLGAQLYAKGGHLSQVSWSEVGANAAGGAVTGAIAGATGGLSLLGDVAVGAGANVAGGIVTRTAEGDDAGKVFSAGEVSKDALAGFVGGGAGHLASEFIHEPEDLGPRPKNGRRRLAKYDAAAKAERNARAKAFAGGTLSSSTFTHGAFNVLNRIWGFFTVSSPSQDNSSVTTSYHDSYAIEGCAEVNRAGGCPE